MIHYYLTPAGSSTKGSPIPKYTDTLPKTTLMDWFTYGEESVFLLAMDIDDVTHTAFAAHADVSAFPQNIDNQVGAALGTVQTQLESFNLPGDVVGAGTTYRTILRGIIAIFAVMQRYAGITGGQQLVFGADTNLDRTLGSIPLAVRNALQQACNELQFNTSSLTGASTIRDLLKLLASQPINITLLGVPI